MKLLLLTAMLFALRVNGQDIPCGATAIIIKGISFKSACTALLDSGYLIDKRDSELQTATTQRRAYPKRFSATYVINLRIVDSTAYFTTTFSAPADGSIVRNEPSIFKCKKNGKPIDNIFTCPFILTNAFVKAFGIKPEYKVK